MTRHETIPISQVGCQPQGLPLEEANDAISKAKALL